MEYWRGYMDWPLDKKWVCPTCGHNVGLEWGMVHAQCRCNNCHTQFTMRAGDEARTILTTPKCTLKPEYVEPVKKIYAEHGVTLDDMTDEIFDKYIK